MLDLYLFGFNYIYVAVTNWKGLSTTGIGYYCLWVAIMAVIFSAINILFFTDLKFAFIWLNWAVLWFLFYLLLAQRKEIGRLTGYMAMVQSWLTCTIPALAILLNFWEHNALWHLMVAIILSYVAILMMLKKSESKLQFN